MWRHMMTSSCWFISICIIQTDGKWMDGFNGFLTVQCTFLFSYFTCIAASSCNYCVILPHALESLRLLREIPRDFTLTHTHAHEGKHRSTHNPHELGEKIGNLCCLLTAELDITTDSLGVDQRRDDVQHWQEVCVSVWVCVLGGVSAVAWCQSLHPWK